MLGFRGEFLSRSWLRGFAILLECGNLLVSEADLMKVDIPIAQKLAEIAAFNRLDVPIRYKAKAQNTRFNKGQPMDEGSDIVTVLVMADGSKYRLDYDSHVTKWQDGAAAYFEENKSVSFNGKYTSEVVYRQGAEGSLADFNQAKIYDGISDRVFIQTSAVGFAYFSQMLSVLEAGSLEEAYQRTFARKNVMWSVDVGDGKLLKVHAEVVNGESYMREVISFDRDFGGGHDRKNQRDRLNEAAHTYKTSSLESA